MFNHSLHDEPLIIKVDDETITIDKGRKLSFYRIESMKDKNILEFQETYIGSGVIIQVWENSSVARILKRVFIKRAEPDWANLPPLSRGNYYSEEPIPVEIGDRARLISR